MRIAGELDVLNRERREIEAGMQAQAAALLEGIDDTVSDAGGLPVSRRLAPPAGGRDPRRRG